MHAHDALVIGAGHNGLVAANVLADAGWDVLVLEAAPEPGGAVRSGEFVEAGYVSDWCSAFYPFAPVSPLARLDLEAHGLQWTRAPLTLAHPSSDGTCPTLCVDPAETAEVLEQLHRGDGRAWLDLYDGWRRIGGATMDALFRPMPPIRASVRLAVRGRGNLLRGARAALLPARRFAAERFGGEAARRFFLASAMHADPGPDATGSAVFGWLLLMLGQQHGFPVPVGGAGAITAALVARLRSRGGEVRCNAPVTGVVTSGGRAVGVVAADGEHRARWAVIADVDAPRLFRDLVGYDVLPPRFVEDLRRFEWDHATFKVDWTLDRPVEWQAAAARSAGTVHVADDVDALVEHHASIMRERLPRRPFLLTGQQSMTDRSRQPPGKETLWAYTHLPHRLRGDDGGEISRLDGRGRELFADRMEAQIEALAPGFRSTVRRRHILGPEDMEAHDGNLVHGAVGGGTQQLHQMAVFRPVPGWGRTETPVRRLYLGSASAHPGGALHGAPGTNAARAAILHRRIRR